LGLYYGQDEGMKNKKGLPMFFTKRFFKAALMSGIKLVGIVIVVIVVVVIVTVGLSRK
jgi:hypothetical protein